MTPEGRIKDKIKTLLKAFGAYYHMPVLNGMGAPTLDFIFCVKGLFFSVEAKAPGKKPTPRQQVTMHAMGAAGAFVFVVSCDDELLVLQEYLQLICNVTFEQAKNDRPQRVQEPAAKSQARTARRTAKNIPDLQQADRLPGA